MLAKNKSAHFFLIEHPACSSQVAHDTFQRGALLPWTENSPFDIWSSDTNEDGGKWLLMLVDVVSPVGAPCVRYREASIMGNLMPLSFDAPSSPFQGISLELARRRLFFSKHLTTCRSRGVENTEARRSSDHQSPQSQNEKQRTNLFLSSPLPALRTSPSAGLDPYKTDCPSKFLFSNPRLVPIHSCSLLYCS